MNVLLHVMPLMPPVEPVKGTVKTWTIYNPYRGAEAIGRVTRELFPWVKIAPLLEIQMVQLNPKEANENVKGNEESLDV